MECILLGIFYGSWELSHALIHLISWTNTSPSQVEGKNFPFFVLDPFLFYSGGYWKKKNNIPFTTLSLKMWASDRF